ncbi:hypothetical protein ACFSHR_05795 [Azotobacter chroococcum]
MTAPFGSLTAALDAAVMGSLSDGQGDYLSASGVVLASGLELILDRDVERLDLASGASTAASPSPSAKPCCSPSTARAPSGSTARPGTSTASPATTAT